MLEGCVPWPDEVAQQYRQAGVWEGITVAEMVARAARNHPDRTAVIHGDRRTTYRELVHGAQALADGLLGLGLEPLDRAVVQLPNIPEFVTMYFAMNAIGVIPVMALRSHRHAEIRHFVRASGAAAYVIPDVVGSFDYRSMANEMAGEFPSLKHTIVIGKPAPGQVALDITVFRTGSRSRQGPGAGTAVARRSIHNAAVGRHDLAVEARSAHSQRLRPERAAVCASRGIQQRHRVHGGAPVGPQLQPGISRACWEHFTRAARSSSRPAPTPGKCLRRSNANESP